MPDQVTRALKGTSVQLNGMMSSYISWTAYESATSVFFFYFFLREQHERCFYALIEERIQQHRYKSINKIKIHSVIRDLNPGLG
jgi:hypothetical protein